MSHVAFTLLAETDLNGILDYIARDKPLAAERFVTTLRKKCRLLADNPELGQCRPAFRSGEYRTFSVGNYVIFYRPTHEGVEIARVVSGHRDMDSLL
jgi:toxin ParE1/3/4